MIRFFSLFAYIFIFLRGSMIIIPLGCMMLFGIFDSEPIMILFYALADLAFITTCVLFFSKRNKWTASLEIVLFILLLLPLLKIFLSFSFVWFNYFLFLFPAICFITLFPISIFLNERKFRKSKAISPNLDK